MSTQETTKGEAAPSHFEPSHFEPSHFEPVELTEQELAQIRFDGAGLVAAVIQEYTTRAVLMVAYMDAEALRRTLQSGRTWFYSRSRQEYWCKGETSGDRQYVRSVAYDCDGDAILVEVDQHGAGACHTGSYSCFFRFFGQSGAEES